MPRSGAEDEVSRSLLERQREAQARARIGAITTSFRRRPWDCTEFMAVQERIGKDLDIAETEGVPPMIYLTKSIKIVEVHRRHRGNVSHDAACTLGGNT